MGYAGGTLENPTYRRLGDHTESFEVTFDPAVVTYSQILDVFWKTHNPCSSGGSRQYRNVVLYKTDEQKKAAEAAAAAMAEKSGREVATPIEKLTRFWVAEEYHQKYYLQRYKGVVAALKRSAGEVEWYATTAAARLNTHVDDPFPIEELIADLKALGAGPDLLGQVEKQFPLRGRRS